MVKQSLSLGLICCLWATIVGSVQCLEPEQDIESLAQTVCVTTKGTKKQISSVHQISQLVQFFQSLSSDHKLFSCRNVYLESIEDLERVVNSANDDACGETKIKLLEDFHRKYVSKVSKHLHEQKRGNKAPKMVKLFFMQYANQISSICEQSAVSFLENYEHSIADEKLDKLVELRKFTDALGLSDSSEGYKGISLFWPMIDSLGYGVEKKFAKYLASGEQRINIQMKDGKPIRYLQALCRYKLRPAYSKSVLPVLRLVDMGYYPRSKQLLVGGPKLQSMLLITQVCETLLPVRVFDDEKLVTDQFVAMTLEEAAQAEPPKEIEGWTMEKVQVKSESVADMDVLVSSDEIEAQANLESVKANVAIRAKVVSRLMRNVVKQVKEKMRKFGKMLFQRGANKQLESINEEAINNVNEELIFQEPEYVNDDEDGIVSSRGHRLKRGGFWWDFAILAGAFFWSIYVVILFIIKLAIIGIPSLIAIITENRTLSRPLAWLWKFGFDPTDPIPDDY